MTRAAAIGTFLLASTIAASSFAADLPSRNAPAPAPVFVDAFQPFQIRLKATAIIPDGKTSMYDSLGMILPGAGLSFGPGGQIFGAGAKVSTTIIPEIDFAYFFTRNISIETLCCVTRHNIKGTGSLAGWNIGSTWALPATVLLQYHFTNFGAFQPYIGVGVHYDIYLGTKGANTYTPFYVPAANIYLGYAGVSSLSIKNSWGVAGQVGFDYMFNDNWGFNVDLKRYLMQPSANATVLHSMFGPVPVRAKVNIDPWIVSAGITYRFGGASGPVVAKY